VQSACWAKLQRRRRPIKWMRCRNNIDEQMCPLECKMMEQEVARAPSLPAPNVPICWHLLSPHASPAHGNGGALLDEFETQSACAQAQLHVLTHPHARTFTHTWARRCASTTAGSGMPFVSARIASTAAASNTPRSAQKFRILFRRAKT